MLVAILLVLFLVATVGGISGLVGLKKRQGELPPQGDVWRSETGAGYVSPAEIAYEDSRLFARNAYQIEVFDDVAQIVLRPATGRRSPTRLFYPQWHVQRSSIVSTRLEQRKFMFDRQPREAVSIQFRGRSGNLKRLSVGTADSAHLLVLLGR